MTRAVDNPIVSSAALYPADGLAAHALQYQRDLGGSLDVGDTLQAIRDIAEGVCERLDGAATLGDILFALNDHLFNVLGFHCAEECAATPEQVLLNHVLQSREAEPLSLGILYISVGRWLGLSLSGCDYPGRFLVRYHDEQGGVIIDPACGGIQLQEEDLLLLLEKRFGVAAAVVTAHGFLSEVSDSNIVVRLLRRLKQAYIKRGESVPALQVQEKIMQQLPDTPVCFRERGQLYEQLDCPHAAAEDYSRYLDLAPDATDAPALRRRLSQLMCQPQVLH